jgi:hypothetical protein
MFFRSSQTATVAGLIIMHEKLFYKRFQKADYRRAVFAYCYEYRDVHKDCANFERRFFGYIKPGRLKKTETEPVACFFGNRITAWYAGYVFSAGYGGNLSRSTVLLFQIPVRIVA